MCDCKKKVDEPKFLQKDLFVNLSVHLSVNACKCDPDRLIAKKKSAEES